MICSSVYFVHHAQGASTKGDVVLFPSVEARLQPVRPWQERLIAMPEADTGEGVTEAVLAWQTPQLRTFCDGGFSRTLTAASALRTADDGIIAPVEHGTSQ